MTDSNGTGTVEQAPIVLLLALLAAGCTTRVIPPAAPLDPVRVYLTDYGRHSSILLPAGDSGFHEYAFGDWKFFAEGRTSLPVALRALLGSPGATLGRRHISADAGADLADKLDAKRLMSFNAPREHVEALAIQLNSRFQHAHNAPYYSTYSSLYHIPDSEPYWAGNNCNHVTANWLRQLGCEIRGPAIFSNFIITAPPQRQADPFIGPWP